MILANYFQSEEDLEKKPGELEREASKTRPSKSIDVFEEKMKSRHLNTSEGGAVGRNSRRLQQLVDFDLPQVSHFIN